jgi:hypothetical protein
MNLLPPPGPQRTRQLTALGVLVTLGAGLAWYFLGPDTSTAPGPAAASVSSSNTAGGSTSNQRGTRAGGAGELPTPLKLATLDPPEDEVLPPATRNPFRFGEPPRPPAPVYTGPVAPVQTGPVVPPGPPPPPEIPLVLQGLVTSPDGVRTALLKEKAEGGRQFQGVEGQVIDGRYRVVKVGLESVVMSYLDGSGMRTIALAR